MLCDHHYESAMLYTTMTGATSIMVMVNVGTRVYEVNSLKSIPVQTRLVCKKELAKAWAILLYM